MRHPSPRPNSEPPPHVVLDPPVPVEGASDPDTESVPVPGNTARKETFANELRRELHVLGKRRRFLIDRRSQLRAAVMVTATTLVLLILLNLSLNAARSQSTSAILAHTPALEEMLREHDRMESGLILAGSIVFLVAVFLVTILETHKTAGAAFNLERKISDIRDGRYDTRLVLRKDDNLRGVEQAFNEMSRALHDRTRYDAEELEQAAGLASNVASPVEAQALAEKLSGMAAQMNARLG